MVLLLEIKGHVSRQNSMLKNIYDKIVLFRRQRAHDFVALKQQKYSINIRDGIKNKQAGSGPAMGEKEGGIVHSS